MLGFGEQASELCGGDVDAALREPQQRHPGLGLAAERIGTFVGVLGHREFAAQPVQLGLDVVGAAEGQGIDRFGEPGAGVPGNGHGVGPGAVEHQELGAVQQAVPPVQDEAELGLTPPRERVRPLLAAAKVEQLVAGVDDRAVRVADGHRRDLAGLDRHHGLVEQRQALGDLAEVDQAPALSNPGEREQLPVAEPVTDLGGPPERGARRRDVAIGEDAAHPGRVLKEPALDTVEVGLVQQAV